jgi:hypothetical protein
VKRFRQAIQEIPLFGIRILTVDPALLDPSAEISQQTGLLHNDALVIAVMRAHGLTNLASADPDFDRVPRSAAMVRFESFAGGISFSYHLLIRGSLDADGSRVWQLGLHLFPPCAGFLLLPVQLVEADNPLARFPKPSAPRRVDGFHLFHALIALQ